MSRESTRRKKEAAAFRRKSMVIITLIVLVIAAVLVMLTISLKKENEATVEKLNSLQSQVAEEQARADELEAEKEYMQGKEFIEKIARERLGLVSPSDTIIKPEE